MMVGLTRKGGHVVVGQPLEILGLENAILVYPDGHREQLMGVELSGKYNLADGICHATPEGCHLEIDGHRVGFA